MYTLQIQHALQDVNSFLGVYASDLLPLSIVHTGTIIVNTDPHTEPGLHWQSIYFKNPHCTSNGYFFDSYGRYPFIPSIQYFIRRHCTVWQYNRTQLQGPTTTVCGEYCCLFTLYMDRGYTPQQLVGCLLLNADRNIHQLFCSEFGPARCKQHSGGQCCTSLYKRWVINLNCFVLYDIAQRWL